MSRCGTPSPNLSDGSSSFQPSIRIALTLCLTASVACDSSVDRDEAGASATETTTSQGDDDTSGADHSDHSATSDGEGGSGDTGISDASDDVDQPDDDDDGVSDDADSGEDTGPSVACEGRDPVPPGVRTLGVDVDGTMRSYELFVPTSYDPTIAAPLVLNFHGLLGAAAQQSGLSQFNLVAEPRGMVVAYPTGIGQSFNAGACCGDASSDGVDDVGFARALVQQVSEQLCIDPARVYVTGMSNGGHMAHLLACEAADIFAAAASVTGVLTVPPQLCNASRPISVMDFHGSSDPIVPFGGTGIGFPSVTTMMEDWAARNGCQGGSTVSFEQGDMRCDTWGQCGDDVEVTLCVTDGGGHCWPGAASCLFGNVSSELSASEAIATMFMAHPM
ncbi:MAG: prolyl oligopeptidase family serine peptidase [Nannocystaceae bacterium]|nr:prolyl oligopeptidase family serine peptidase [Nannocystaceae bacterium]